MGMAYYRWSIIFLTASLFENNKFAKKNYFLIVFIGCCSGPLIKNFKPLTERPGLSKRCWQFTGKDRPFTARQVLSLGGWDSHREAWPLTERLGLWQIGRPLTAREAFHKEAGLFKTDVLVFYKKRIASFTNKIGLFRVCYMLLYLDLTVI